MEVHSFCIEDAKPRSIAVEFSARFQIPVFQILGLPAPEIQEARERIISAFGASDLEFPKKRVVINLAPASIPKSGTGHDLPIALKILAESRGLDLPEPLLAWGELGLNGALRAAGKPAHLLELFLHWTGPTAPRSIVLGPEDARSFTALWNWRRDHSLPLPRPPLLFEIRDLKEAAGSLSPSPRFLDPEDGVRQHSTGSSPSRPGRPENTPLLPLGPLQERILKIAAIGRHHLLILGPKGSGKSALLDWFRAVASPATPPQAWERALFQESRGDGPDFSPPIRRVHSQVRPAHLLGNFTSGTFRAGELSLSHGGILFADEFPEWPRDAKECLREPLESERILLTRTRGSHQAKCELQLIASGNLCPCGGFPARLKGLGLQSRIRCRCTETEFFQYLKRLSGPILDRIDLIPIFQEPCLPDFTTRPDPERILSEIRKKQQLAISKWGALPSRLHPEVLELGIQDSPLLLKRLQSMDSLRSRHKTLRLAHTIQILEESPDLRMEHLLEACSYRWLDSFL